MKFGVHLPHIGPFADRIAIRDHAQRAEALGFDSLWVSDHVVVPRSIASRYPYSPTGDFIAPPEAPWIDCLTTLAYAAAVTERVALGTTVLVIPMRNPVTTAKTLAGIDVLSGGRLILGAGAGWMAEEFAELDAPFRHRGRRFDEYLQIIRNLWTKDDPSFEGEFYRLSNVGFEPKPVQRPAPPIWIGGHTTAAMRRAARLGDGWHPAFLEAEEIGRLLPSFRAFVAEYGRESEPPALTARVNLGLRELDPDGAIERIRPFAELGVEHMLVEWFGAMNPEAAEHELSLFAREVRPAFA